MIGSRLVAWLRFVFLLQDRLPPQVARLLGVLVMVLALQTTVTVSIARSYDWAFRPALDQSMISERTIAREVGIFGLPTLGVGVLMISGGIDLSIGSVVGLGAVCFGLLLERPNDLWVIRIIALLGALDLAAAGYFLADRAGLKPWLSGLIAVGAACVLAGILPPALSPFLMGQRNSPWFAALVVIWGSMHVGLAHGLLVTKMQLQPFLVTLCGLFMYRGLAKWLSPEHNAGWQVEGPDDLLTQIRGFRQLFVGNFYGVPNELVLMLVTAVVLALFLHGTRHGRYLFAIGANEEAARYAGIPTDRYKVLAYVISSTLAGLASVVFLLYYDAAQPTNAGSWWELYAITGAVLGGCSLRGGEGSIPGLVLGTAVLPLLLKVCYSIEIPSELEFLVIGAALLLGTTVDELLKRRGPRRA